VLEKQLWFFKHQCLNREFFKMIINKSSSVIQLLNETYSDKSNDLIQRINKFYNISGVYCAIVFNLVNSDKPLSRKRLAKLIGVSEKTVNNSTKFLCELGLLTRIKGEKKSIRGEITQSPTKYKVTELDDLEVFKQLKNCKRSFNNLIDFFLQFGRSKRIKWQNYYVCPDCRNNSVSVKKDGSVAYCHKCNKGFSKYTSRIEPPRNFELLFI